MAPAIVLQGWQQRWMRDRSRRKFLVKSVQVGGSFIATLEVVIDCIERKTLWIMLSASDRQSIEMMEKVKMHCAAMGAAIEDEPPSFFEDTKIIQHTAVFPNGSRIIALPANPDTARGFSGNVLLDEFAIHRDAKAIWKAMVGRTLRGFRLIVLSSFKGKQNKFYDLAKELGLADGVAPDPNPMHNETWSGHWVDIRLAVQEGLNIDLAELERTVGDTDIFNEEFLCIPTDGAQDFIGIELVLSCESPAASITFDYESRPGLYFGFDIARKRDLSVIWIIELLEDGTKLTRGVITMWRMKFEEQKAIARKVAAVCERGCVDATGIGANLAENLSDEFPGRIEAVEFSGPNKERMAMALKTDMENRAFLLPDGDVAIRRAIQAVKKFTGSTGGVRFDAARTAQGHADEFWAAALANAAAQKAGGYVPASECGMQGRTVMGNVMERVF
jgi:phage FluMu gp28-like protein